MSDQLTIQAIEYKRKITLFLPTEGQHSILQFSCFAPTIESAIQQAIDFCDHKDNNIRLDKSHIDHQRKHFSFSKFVVSIEQVLIT